MTIIMGIDPGISGAIRKERGRYGSKIMPGQYMSGRYPGFICCGNDVYRKPHIWRNKQGRDRSSNYYYVEATCGHCSKAMLQAKANFKRTKNAFCSAECKRAFMNAKSSGNKILKKRDHGHHVQVKSHTHPNRSKGNLVYEHALVAEAKIGRLLVQGERVHHINLIKNDNDPKNLFVCANNTEHLKIHGTLNKCVAELMLTGALRFDADAKAYVVVPQ